LEIVVITKSQLFVTSNGKHEAGTECDWKNVDYYKLYTADLQPLRLIPSNSNTMDYGLTNVVTAGGSSVLAVLKNETHAIQIQLQLQQFA
jgi:hypothetical protein